MTWIIDGVGGRRLLVERTSDGEAAAMEHMGVDHRCFEVLVAEQILDGADVVSILEEVGGEAMAERVARDPLPDPGLAGSGGDGLLGGAWAEMVSASQAGAGVLGESPGREDELP